MAEVAATSQSNVLLESISPVTELEVSHVDSIERETVDKFFSAVCGCKLGPDNASCSILLCRELAVTTRNDCLQLEKNEMDPIVLSQLQAFRSHPDQPVSMYSLSKLQRHTVFNFHIS